MQFWAPDDGRKNRRKHVERLTEINKLRKLASCWFYPENILAMHGTVNVKHTQNSALIQLSPVNKQTILTTDRFSIRLSLFRYCSTKKWQGPNLHKAVSCQFETAILLLSKKNFCSRQMINHPTPCTLLLQDRRNLSPCFKWNNVTGNLPIHSHIWKTEQNLKRLRRINNKQQWM